MYKVYVYDMVMLINDPIYFDNFDTEQITYHLPIVL